MIESASIAGLALHDEGGAVELTEFEVGSPAPRAVLEPLAGDHGEADATEYYHGRTINVRGEVWGQDWPAFWAAVDALKGAFSLGPMRPLVFRREGLPYDETALVRVDSALDLPLQHGAAFAAWGVTLLAPDPRLYAVGERVASYDLRPITPSGLAFPLAFPLAFTDGTPVEYGLDVDVGGNFATPPRFVVVGPVSNPVIANETTGDSIVTRDLTLLEGEQLHVDVRTRTLRLDAPTGAPRADLVDAALTRWWQLRPGANTVRLTGIGTSPGTTTLTAVWRDARI